MRRHQILPKNLATTRPISPIAREVAPSIAPNTIVSNAKSEYTTLVSNVAPMIEPTSRPVPPRPTAARIPCCGTERAPTVLLTTWRTVAIKTLAANTVSAMRPYPRWPPSFDTNPAPNQTMMQNAATICTTAASPATRPYTAICDKCADDRLVKRIIIHFFRAPRPHVE